MLNFLKKKAPNNVPVAAQVVQHVVQAELPASRRLLKALGVRPGMWVHVADKGVGIVTDGHYDGTLDVMLTDLGGFNLEKVTVMADSVVQAAYRQIPELRRPASAAAEAMGYL